MRDTTTGQRALGVENWFDRGGAAYARFRPRYPDELARHLAQIAPASDLALDVGCGSGQLTAGLARYFDAVVGIDPSASQLASAASDPRIACVCARAEALPLRAHCVPLICAAQAAHWFDLPAFYREVRRVARGGARIALASYGTPTLEGVVGERFRRFYDRELAAYWPPERRLVESGYRTLDFPFAELPAPELAIHCDWTLDAFLGYLSTWSAVRRLRAAGRERLLADFSRDLAGLWGAAEQSRRVTWPINLRVGTVAD